MSATKSAPTSGSALTDYFVLSVKRVKLHYNVRWLGGVNRTAVRREIVKWLREGDDPAIIQAMIDYFAWNYPAWMHRPVPVWKIFLAEREALRAAVQPPRRRVVRHPR